MGFVPISTVLLQHISSPFFEPVSALPFPIPRTYVSGGFIRYVSLWRGYDPAACTIAFDTTGVMTYPVGLDIIMPEPIEISYILHDIILKVFFFFTVGKCIL